MNLKPNKLIIKAPGNWNPKIFTPPWIAKNLLNQEFKEIGEKISLLFNPAKGETAYEIEGIILLPSLNEFQIAIEDIENINEKNLVSCTTFLNRILELLPHTPIIAIGFNVIYLLKDSHGSKLVQWYREHQSKGFEDLKLNQVALSNNFDSYILNIIMKQVEREQLSINFNYHFEKWQLFESNIYLQLIENSERYLNVSV